MLKLKARTGPSYAVNGPSPEEVAAARVNRGLRLMDEIVAESAELARATLADRRAELAQRSLSGTGRVITQDEALKLIAAKRQAAAKPKRSRGTRARVGRCEVF